MMSKILRMAVCLFVAAFASVQGFAQSETQTQKYLVIDLADETTQQFELAGGPVLTFGDGNFVLTAGTVVNTWKLSEVAGYHFSSQATDISSVAKGSLGIHFTDNETIVVEGNEAFSASLFDTAGRTIDRKSSNGGSVSLSLAGQPAGVYIVKMSDGKSFKFLKK